MNLKANLKKKYISNIFLTVKELKNLKKYIFNFFYFQIYSFFMMFEFYNISSKLSEHNHKNQQNLSLIYVRKRKLIDFGLRILLYKNDRNSFKSFFSQLGSPKTLPIMFKLLNF